MVTGTLCDTAHLRNRSHLRPCSQTPGRSTIVLGLLRAARQPISPGATNMQGAQREEEDWHALRNDSFNSA
eukprot:3471644-Alexandrium_andersonii.AAC.1